MKVNPWSEGIVYQQDLESSSRPFNVWLLRSSNIVPVGSFMGMRHGLKLTRVTAYVIDRSKIYIGGYLNYSLVLGLAAIACGLRYRFSKAKHIPLCSPKRQENCLPWWLCRTTMKECNFLPLISSQQVTTVALWLVSFAICDSLLCNKLLRFTHGCYFIDPSPHCSTYMCRRAGVYVGLHNGLSPVRQRAFI